MLTIAAMTIGVLAYTAHAQQSCECVCNSVDQGSIDVSDCGSCTAELCNNQYGSCQGSRQATCSSGGGGTDDDPGSADDDPGSADDDGVTVSWTGSASGFVSAYRGYYESSGSDETYCVSGSTVTGSLSVGTIVITMEDSTDAIAEQGATDIIFVAGSATLNGNSIGYIAFAVAKQDGNIYLASSNAQTSMDDARSAGVNEAAATLLDGQRAAFDEGFSLTCNSGGGGSGSSLAASVMAGGLLTAGMCLAGGAVVAL